MTIDIRDVELDHIDEVAPLWDEAWRSGGRRRGGLPLALSLDRMRRRVEAAAGGGFRFLAAWHGDEPVGLATVSLTDGGPMMDAPGVHIHMLHVAQGTRCRLSAASAPASSPSSAAARRSRPQRVTAS